MVSLGFRIRFVFTVCHGFPHCGVTIFDPCTIEFAPSQIRTCAVNASGSQASLVVSDMPSSENRGTTVPDTGVRRTIVRIRHLWFSVSQSRCDTVDLSPLVRLGVRAVSDLRRVMPWLPFLHRNYPAAFLLIGCQASSVLCSHPTP